MTTETPTQPVQPKRAQETGKKRRFTGVPASVLKWFTVLYSGFALLYIGGVFQFFNLFIFPARYDALFFMVMISFCFLLFPATKGASRTRVPWYDIIAIVLAVVANVYIIAVSLDLATQPHRLPNGIEQALGIVTILLTLEGVRRTAGLGLAIVGLVFTLYPFFTGYIPGTFLQGRNQSLPRVIEMYWLFPGGIYGNLLHLMAALVFIFLLFGSFLQIYKAGDFFVKLAYSVMGRFRGGPAKVAVLACGLFGMINGSGAANVAAIGPITIPMIKKVGYSNTTAAAVVAVASNGGQIMPPVLGLAAFMMMQFLGVTYGELIIAAIFPALLYYIATFVMIDLEAVRMGLKGQSRNELPSFTKTIVDGWPFTIPIIILVTLLLLKYSPETAGIISIVSLVLVSYWKSDIKLGWIPIVIGLTLIFTGLLPLEVATLLALAPMFLIAFFRKTVGAEWKKFTDSLHSGFNTVPDTGLVIVMAGILVAAFDLTGVGVRMTGGLVELAGGNLFLLLLMTAIAAIVLGMGMPTSAVYLLVAMLLAPALVKVGMIPIVAHFFAFYFGLAAMLTPPVCPVAFIAAGMAGAPFMKTGWESMRLGIIVFIVPFMFAYGPALLMIGSPADIAVSAVTALAGVVLLSAGLVGYLLKNMSWLERVLMIAAGLALIAPFWQASVIGAAVGAALIVWQVTRRKRPAAPTPLVV